MASAAILAALADDANAVAWLKDIAAEAGDARSDIHTLARSLAGRGLSAVALVKLGRAAALDEPDMQLGGRITIGFDPRMSPDDLAWSTAGRWHTRPADLLCGVAAGRIQVVLATPAAGWRQEGGRRFHVDPYRLTDAGAVRVRTGEVRSLTPSESSGLTVLAGRTCEFPGGGRNPVRRLDTER